MESNPNTVPTKISLINITTPYPTDPAEAVSSSSDVTMVTTLRKIIFASSMGFAKRELPLLGDIEAATTFSWRAPVSDVESRDWDSSSCDEGGSSLVRFMREDRRSGTCQWGGAGGPRAERYPGMC